jgi:hypothetical protein
MKQGMSVLREIFAQKPGPVFRGNATRLHPLSLCLLVVTALLGMSCSGRITGVVKTDEQGEFIIEAELAPASARLLTSLSPTSAASAPVLDAAVIALSLRNAPGISSVRMQNATPESITGSIGFAKISDLLAAGNFRFITWTPGRALITLDRRNGPQMITMLSQDVSDYLSAIMAPIATGEPLTRTEYLRLITSVYGSALAREIEGAEITASITFPGRITKAEGGTFSENMARFRVKLVDLLVLEKPLGYEVRWSVP